MTRRRHPSHIAVGALALAVLPAFWPSGAMAHTCDAPFSTNLIAGQTIDAGDVKVCNDDTNLTVTYEATFPWCLLATDLHVATSESGIPQTSKGNPKPDEFAIGDVHDCVGTASFEIPLDEIDGGVSPGATVFVAAHAEVEDDTGRQEGAWGKGPRFVQRGNWAMYFNYTVQAPPPSTSCVCDALRVGDGTTGAELLALFCPNGELASPEFIFVDSSAFTGAGTGNVHYFVDLRPATPLCELIDFAGSVLRHAVTLNEAEACRTHLRVSCGQPEP
jgi:hypothetical protein